MLLMSSEEFRNYTAVLFMNDLRSHNVRTHPTVYNYVLAAMFHRKKTNG
jgi:hypothetical protein